jgi:tetratricopeptide (TPR) repeat protein
MNKILVFCLILVLGSASVFAAGQDAFADANQRFKAGDYAGAAAAYEKVLADEGPRASVYYNLGNAYQNLKQFGPAILAYERARLLTPRDPDLLANLALARRAVAAFEETGRDPRLEVALNFLSRNEWSWLVAGSALFLGVVSVLSGEFGLRRRGMRQAAVVYSCIAVVCIGIGSAALYLRRDEAKRGIVLTENAAVHLSPFEEAESLGTPGPGRTVHMREKKAGFHYIEVPGTHLRGWLPDKEVEAIVPLPAPFAGPVDKPGHRLPERDGFGQDDDNVRVF